LRRFEPSFPLGRTGLTLLVVASSVFLVASCGDDDDGGQAGPTKAQLVQKANAICKRHNDKIAAASSKVLAGGRLPTPKQFGKLAMGTIVPEYSAQVQELSRLKPPDEVAGAYRSWLDESRSTRAMIAKDPSLITNPNSFKGVNRKSDELGFSKACHVGPDL